MSEQQRPKAHLTGYQLQHLGEFVKGLNKLAREHGIDVCPHGPITIEVAGPYSEMRLNLDRDGEGEYVIKDQP